MVDVETNRQILAWAENFLHAKVDLHYGHIIVKDRRIPVVDSPWFHIVMAEEIRKWMAGQRKLDVAQAEAAAFAWMHHGPYEFIDYAMRFTSGPGAHRFT